MRRGSIFFQDGEQHFGLRAEGVRIWATPFHERVTHILLLLLYTCISISVSRVRACSSAAARLEYDGILRLSASCTIIYHV